MRVREIPLTAGATTCTLRFSAAALRILDPTGKLTVADLVHRLQEPDFVAKALRACLEGHRLKAAAGDPAFSQESADAILDVAGYSAVREAISQAILAWLNPNPEVHGDPKAETVPAEGPGLTAPSAP